MNKKVQLLKYVVSDTLTALAAWFAVYFYWKFNLTISGADEQQFQDVKRIFLNGSFIIPFFWLTVYYLAGYYHDVVRKSRLLELWQTFGNVFIGSVLIYIMAGIHNTCLIEIKRPLSPFLTLMSFQFLITYIPRLTITTINTRKVHSGKVGFRTLLIGGNSKAVETWREVISQKRGSGNIFIGFVSVNGTSKNILDKYLPNLGKIDDIHNIIREKNVEEVIIAIEYAEHDLINLIINKLINVDVEIKAIPSLYDILTGRVRMSSILGTPLISVSHNPMPAWQQNVKSFLDRIIAAVALIITLPISIILAIGIKLSSKGPIFYSHERVGRYGKPFNIYKFRSMYVDAEKNGPELSSKSDERVTPFGRFMRRTRLDEIPNFINVLRGEMSLVGPRPERKYYIEQIIQTAPHYLHLLKVKPGITSWGQVKYGYAENVEQMIQRLKYDLLYLDNMSLFVDFKILIYTFLTIIKRKGI